MSRRSQISLIGISGIVVTENGWRSVTLSPRSADLLDTDLHMICLIGLTCSTPTSFWFRPP
jgi:hypothetical protein